MGFYGNLCHRQCSNCPTGCDRISGGCNANCPVGKFGKFCNETCSHDCRNGCIKHTGMCIDGCVDEKLGKFCNNTCDNLCLLCWNQDSKNRKSKRKARYAQIPWNTYFSLSLSFKTARSEIWSVYLQNTILKVYQIEQYDRSSKWVLYMYTFCVAITSFFFHITVFVYSDVNKIISVLYLQLNCHGYKTEIVCPVCM